MPRVKDISTTAAVLEAIENRRDHPALLELHSRLQALRDRRDVETQARETIRERMNNVQGTSLDRLVAALVGDPAASNLDASNVREELARADRMLEGIRLAIRQTEQEILQAECELDATDCRKVAGLHRKNVRQTINAVLALHHAVAAQQGLIRQLSQRGVGRTSHLVSFFPIEFAEELTDSNSYLSTSLREAVQLGFMTEAERVGLLQGRITVLDVDI